jgi:DNA-binding XRE family transcriptional regulator
VVLSTRWYLKRLPRVLLTIRWRVSFAEAGQAARDSLILGEAVREVREQQGISIPTLAVDTGLDQELIVALEDGKLDPDYELLLRLAEGIGVRVSAFVFHVEGLGGDGGGG